MDYFALKRSLAGKLYALRHENSLTSMTSPTQGVLIRGSCKSHVKIRQDRLRHIFWISRLQLKPACSWNSKKREWGDGRQTQNQSSVFPGLGEAQDWRQFQLEASFLSTDIQLVTSVMFLFFVLSVHHDSCPTLNNIKLWVHLYLKLWEASKLKWL